MVFYLYMLLELLTNVNKVGGEDKVAAIWKLVKASEVYVSDLFVLVYAVFRNSLFIPIRLRLTDSTYPKNNVHPSDTCL